MAFSSSCVVFLQVQRGMFNFFFPVPTSCSFILQKQPPNSTSIQKTHHIGKIANWTLQITSNNYLILTKLHKHLIYPYATFLSLFYHLAYTNSTILMDAILHLEKSLSICIFNVWCFYSHCTTQRGHYHHNNPCHHATFLLTLASQTNQQHHPVCLDLFWTALIHISWVSKDTGTYCGW